MQCSRRRIDYYCRVITVIYRSHLSAYCAPEKIVDTYLRKRLLIGRSDRVNAFRIQFGSVVFLGICRWKRGGDEQDCPLAIPLSSGLNRQERVLSDDGFAFGGKKQVNNFLGLLFVLGKVDEI